MATFAIRGKILALEAQGCQEIRPDGESSHDSGPEDVREGGGGRYTAPSPPS